MSFTSPVFGEYGNTQKGQDHALFWGKNHAEVFFSGYGTTAGTKKYLKRFENNNAQGLYIPPETFGSVFVTGLIFDTSSSAPYALVDLGTGNDFENDGGTITVTTTAGTVDTDVIVTVAANSTVDAIEVAFEETSGTRDVYIICKLELFWVNDTYKSIRGSQLFPAAATSALS